MGTVDRRPFNGEVPTRSGARVLVGTVVGAFFAFVAVPAAVATAEPPITPPVVAITSPLNGISTNNELPMVSGTTDNVFDEFRKFSEPPTAAEEVRVDIYRGATASEEVIEKAKTPNFLDGTWSVTIAQALAPGNYTAVAEQSDKAGTGKSQAVTFTIDTTPPAVTLGSPTNGSSTSSSSQLAGSAGTASGDSPKVFVHLYSGATTAAQAAVETVEVPVSSGSWSFTFGGLGLGTYTAQAEQKDEAGNTGLSASTTFTITAPVVAVTTPSRPVASFRWFPTAPAVGESVSLVSTSTDASSPITGFAWALTTGGAFSAGSPVLTTSFSAPGNQVVQLRVTDANGASSVATETIPVAARALPLMLPVPIVRIAGTETSSGVDLSLLGVQAPVNARITVTCHGRGCPSKSQSLIAHSSRKSKASSVQIAFRRFERSLRAGVILEIRVSMPGELGKYTRFSILRHKLPVRVDACLASANPAPIACPS